MKIIEYFSTDNKSHWLSELKQSNWGAGQFLYQLLTEDTLKEIIGPDAKVFLQIDEATDKLVSFCTLSELDDIRPSELSPWIGFVYTFPAYRGHRYAGNMIKHAEEVAITRGDTHVYISTGETGLYEKYGYTFYKMDKDVAGEDSRVYCKKLCQ